MSDADDTIQTEEAIQHLRRYFHVYEGWFYYTLRCEICQQMFGIKPNAPILERSSFDMLMEHAKAHNTTPIRPLDYSRRWQPTTARPRLPPPRAISRASSRSHRITRRRTDDE